MMLRYCCVKSLTIKIKHKILWRTLPKYIPLLLQNQAASIFNENFIWKLLIYILSYIFWEVGDFHLTIFIQRKIIIL